MSSAASAAAASNASRLLARRCSPGKICSVASCSARSRGLSALVRSRRYPSTSTCASSRQGETTAQTHYMHYRHHGRGNGNAQQRRHGSTDKKADAAAESSAAEVKSADDAIRQTEEALAKLKESRGASRARAVEEAFQAAKERAEAEPAVNWARLRTPALFGAGLYLGLVLFGNHRDERKGSDFLAQLKASFEGGPKEKEGRTDSSEGGDGGGGGDDARPEVGSKFDRSGGATSEYEKWKASREGARE